MEGRKRGDIGCACRERERVRERETEKEREQVEIPGAKEDRRGRKRAGERRR